MRWKQSPFIITRPQHEFTVARAYLRGAIAGATTGSTATYLFDPNNGRKRRTELRDRAVHATHRARTLLDAASKDRVHRARGRVAEGFGRFEDPVDDHTLAERVRAQLGHVSSHPKAIAVDARHGHVQLHGHVLAREAPRIVAGVRSVRGVAHVDNALEMHSETEQVASLQGLERTSGDSRWPPGPRLVAAAAAVGLMLYGAGARRSLSGPLATTAGAALLVRSMTNRPLQLDELDAVLEGESPAKRRERESGHDRGPRPSGQPQPERAPFPPEEAQTGVVPRPEPH
jgi:gas vesicle protein